MENKYIRFIDSQYNTLFYVVNGDSIRIKFEDNVEREYACKYIDETHAFIGNNVFHMCEFAERMERYGRTYEPVKEIGDLEFYQKKFYDRENVGPDGRTVPYYELAKVSDTMASGVLREVTYAVCFSPLSEDKTFGKMTAYPRLAFDVAGNYKVEFAGSIEELCEDGKVSGRVNRIVDAIMAEGAARIGIHSDFENFKKNVREKGGIWASNDVHFTEFADGFAASYKPDFPEHSKEDCAISYNYVKDEWNYKTPEQYDAEYNMIGETGESRVPLEQLVGKAEKQKNDDCVTAQKTEIGHER